MINLPDNRPTIKFWNTKTNKERTDGRHLLLNNPALLAVLTFASYYAWDVWGKKLTLTSVYREHLDPNDLHKTWRAVDCRIARNPEEEQIELTLPEWERLAEAINDTFYYGRTWLGKRAKVANIRDGGSGSDTAPHVHLQTPRRAWR